VGASVHGGPLKFTKVESRHLPGLGPYLRGETGGRRYYSCDQGQTWHRTLARAVRADRRGRAGAIA